MHKTFFRISLILLSLSALPTVAAPKLPKPASATVMKPSGADALTGTSGIGTRTKPSDAGALVEKWQTFKAPGVELALPENYRGGSPNTTGLQTLIKGIRSLGTDYEQIASMVEQNPSTFLLIAVDPKPDRTGGVTNVVVSAVKVPETVTVDAYIDAAVQSLPAPLRTIERKIVQVGQNSAGRVVTEASLPSSNTQADALRQLIYVIKDGTTLWTVAYSTRAGDYPQRLAMFEQSIQSFKVQTAQKPGDTTAPKKPTIVPPASNKKPTPAQTRDKKPNPVPTQKPKPETSKPSEAKSL